MSTTEDRSSAAGAIAGVTTNVDMKVEVLVIPVSDVDRAKEFYSRLGWRLDVTPPTVVQFTPHGSGCSVQFGASLTSAAPGSAREYLIVSDIEAARDALIAAGVDMDKIHHLGPDGPVSGPDVERRSYFSRASFSDVDGNSWLLQEITTRLPGRVGSDVVRLGEGPGERDAACGGRARRAREAHRAARRELAGPVRRLRGRGADRRGTAHVTAAGGKGAIR